MPVDKNKNIRGLDTLRFNFNQSRSYNVYLKIIILKCLDSTPTGAEESRRNKSEEDLLLQAAVNHSNLRRPVKRRKTLQSCN